MTTARTLSVYDGTGIAALRSNLSAYHGNQPGDVDKCAGATVDVLTGQGVAKGKQVPIRLVLGTDTLEMVRKKCEQTLALLDEWQDVSSLKMYRTKSLGG